MSESSFIHEAVGTSTVFLEDADDELQCDLTNLPCGGAVSIPGSHPGREMQTVSVLDSCLTLGNIESILQSCTRTHPHLLKKLLVLGGW